MIDPLFPPQIQRLEDEVTAAKTRLAEARRALPPQPVQEYTFRDAHGAAVTLSQLFGSRSDLLVVHNMGKACTYCTLWADGFVGLDAPLNDRAAFVISSPDEPAVMAEFARSRRWPFKMVSIRGTSFARDMGFGPPEGPDTKVFPGISAFHRAADGRIVRTGRSALFGPNDDYCALWPMLDLLKDGPAGWQPKLAYT